MSETSRASYECPAPDWFQAPTGNERIWIGLALAWCMVMSLMMPYWHFKGKQNSSGESYSVKPADFIKRAEKFVFANTGTGALLEEGIAPIVPAPPGEVYLVAKQFAWYPILKCARARLIGCTF